MCMRARERYCSKNTIDDLGAARRPRESDNKIIKFMFIVQSTWFQYMCVLIISNVVWCVYFPSSLCSFVCWFFFRCFYAVVLYTRSLEALRHLRGSHTSQPASHTWRQIRSTRTAWSRFFYYYYYYSLNLISFELTRISTPNSLYIASAQLSVCLPVCLSLYLFPSSVALVSYVHHNVIMNSERNQHQLVNKT